MPVTKQNTTYWAQIYCGLRRGYAVGDLEEVNRMFGFEDQIRQRVSVDKICHQYCDEVGLGVTVTNTTFIYTGGQEPGVIVGLFDYPRFPTGWPKVLAHAKQLAEILLVELKQERLSIVCDDQSYLVEREPETPDVPEDPTMIMNTAEIATEAEKRDIQHAATMEMETSDLERKRFLQKSEDASARALTSARQAASDFEAAAIAMTASGLEGVGDLVRRFQAAANVIQREHDDTIEVLSAWDSGP